VVSVTKTLDYATAVGCSKLDYATAAGCAKLDYATTVGCAKLDYATAVGCAKLDYATAVGCAKATDGFSLVNVPLRCRYSTCSLILMPLVPLCD